MPPTSTGLAGRRCIITGASGGIGAAIARRFAAEGASCTLVGRRRESLMEGCAALLLLPPRGGGEESSELHQQHHRVAVGDVADRSFWTSLALAEKDVDVLVNAAGITHYSLLMTTQPKLVEEVMDTNLMGTVWGCQVMVKNMMRKKGRGCIINVSSLLAVKGGKGSAAYAASKAGILGLTRSLAAEVGSMNIRVNAIVPGYIETQMTGAMTPEARSQALDQIPMKRFGMVEEVADAAVFLARNEYANNCVLNLDGGLSAT